MFVTSKRAKCIFTGARHTGRRSRPARFSFESYTLRAAANAAIRRAEPSNRQPRGPGRPRNCGALHGQKHTASAPSSLPVFCTLVMTRLADAITAIGQPYSSASHKMTNPEELAVHRALLATQCAAPRLLPMCLVFFDAKTNLRLALARHADRLDGLDVSEDDIGVLRRYVDGEYLTNAARQYYLLFGPEEIEHTEIPEWLVNRT